MLLGHLLVLREGEAAWVTAGEGGNTGGAALRHGHGARTRVGATNGACYGNVTRE